MPYLEVIQEGETLGQGCSRDAWPSSLQLLQELCACLYKVLCLHSPCHVWTAHLVCLSVDLVPASTDYAGIFCK